MATKRYINPRSIINFGFTLQASWEGASLGFQLSLPNGGPASLVYGSLFAGIGATTIVLSLAEMASMYVTMQATKPECTADQNQGSGGWSSISMVCCICSQKP